MISSHPTSLYLDANATYGVLPEIRDAIVRFPLSLQNASSIHSGGQAARAVIEESRDAIKELLCLRDSGRIVFTSGATESNNTALALPFFSPNIDATGSSRLLTSRIEHHSVLEMAQRLSNRGVVVDYIEYGELSAEGGGGLQIASKVTPHTKLLSLMLANNETGEIFDISQIAKKCRKENNELLVHSDGVQALGKLPLRWGDLNIDLLSLSAHKIGGLSGSGALVVSKEVESSPFLVGGPQETRWRAGTENLLGIFSFGLAARILKREQESRVEKMKNLRMTILEILLENISGLSVYCAEKAHLPNTAMIHVPGVRADDLVIALDLAGVLLSSGAACASGKPDPSHVLLAMGVSPEGAKESVRLSVTGEMTPEQGIEAAHRIVATIEKMRSGAIRGKHAAISH